MKKFIIILRISGMLSFLAFLIINFTNLSGTPLQNYVGAYTLFAFAAAFLLSVLPFLFGMSSGGYLSNHSVEDDIAEARLEGEEDARAMREENLI